MQATTTMLGRSPARQISRDQFGSFDGPLENAELIAEREDLELQRRPAQGSENSGQRADNKCPNGNRGVNSTSQIINQIGFCENHSLQLSGGSVCPE